MSQHNAVNKYANAAPQTSPWDELKRLDSQNGDTNGTETIIPKQVVATGLSPELMEQLQEREKLGYKPVFGAQIGIEGTLNTQTNRIELTIDSGNLFGSDDFNSDKDDVCELVIRSGQAYNRDDIEQELKCNPETAMLISELTRKGVVAKYIRQGNQLKLRGSVADGDRNSATRYLQFYAGQLMSALDNLGYNLGANEGRLFEECNEAVSELMNEMGEKNVSGISMSGYRRRILRALRKEHPLVLPAAVTRVADNMFWHTMNEYAGKNNLKCVHSQDYKDLVPDLGERRASRNYFDEAERVTDDPTDWRAYFVDMGQFLWR